MSLRQERKHPAIHYSGSNFDEQKKAVCYVNIFRTLGKKTYCFRDCDNKVTEIFPKYPLEEHVLLDVHTDGMPLRTPNRLPK